MNPARTITLVLALAAAAPLAGCATAAGYDGARSLVPVVDQREIFGDLERLQFSKQVQVRLPARGVLSLQCGDPRWSQVVTDALESDPGTWTTVEPLQVFHEDHRIAPGHLEPLRAAASRQQADLLVISSIETRDDDSTNALGIFKLLLLPMLFLPTDEHKVTLTTRASVIDVRNGLLYATIEDHREREFTTTTAAGSSKVRAAVKDLVAETAANLREKMERKLRALEQTN
jgi:hypothetical protein